MAAYSELQSVGNFKEVETLAWFDGTRPVLNSADKHVLFDDSSNSKVTIGQGNALWANERGGLSDIRFEGLSTPSGTPPGAVYTRIYDPTAAPGGTISNTGTVELQYLDANGDVVGTKTLWVVQGYNSFGEPANGLHSEPGFVLLTDGGSNIVAANANLFVWGPDVPVSGPSFVSADEAWRGGENFQLLDGVVSGTGGDDLIDVNYTGDPEGDVIDGLDGPPGHPNDDIVEAGAGNDTVLAGLGNDTVYGGDGNDTLRGESGDDTLDGQDGQDNLYGGTGNDTLLTDGGNDNLFGEDDADTFRVNGLAANGVYNFTVNGGSGGNDDDTLDVSYLLDQGFEITNFVQNPEANGNPGFNGQIQLFNPGTGQSANINFNDIENFIICFTPGTMIGTMRGEVPVERLRPGDRVITRDNGAQRIAWTGSTTLPASRLAANPHLRPILIRAGALGEGLPERDLVVSPNHRVLMFSEKSQLYFDEREVLAAAKHLTGAEGIQALGAGPVTYIHFMFERHEVVLSNGSWTESFHPGDFSLNGIGAEQRSEIFEIFPELETAQGLGAYRAARRSLKRHEALLLMG